MVDAKIVLHSPDLKLGTLIVLPINAMEVTRFNLQMVDVKHVQREQMQILPGEVV